MYLHSESSSFLTLSDFVYFVLFCIAPDTDRFPGANLFALTIKGDSMKDAAILDGDLVICSPRQFAKNGEIIVALIDNEDATVKRFFKRNNKIELCPENNKFKSKFYNFDEILIQGKVIGIIREPKSFS